MIEAAVDGRLTQDPEIRVSAKGTPWVRLTIMAETAKEVALLIGTAVFDEEVQILAKTLKKGDRVQAIGPLSLKGWTDKSGTVKQGHNLVAHSLIRLSLPRKAVGDDQTRRERQKPADEPRGGSFNLRPSSDVNVPLDVPIPF